MARPEALFIRPNLATRYELMAQLRRATPVYESPFGFLLLTRYRDVKSLLTSRQFGSRLFVEGGQLGSYQQQSRSRLGEQSPEGLYVELMSHSLLFVEPPAHTQLRRMLAPWFTREAAAALEPTVRAIADDCSERLVAEIRREGVADLVKHLSRPVPLRVTTSLLGLPPDDAARIGAWSDAFAGGFELLRGRRKLRAAGLAAREFADYFEAQRHHAADRAGVLKDLLELAAAGSIETQHVIANTALLLGASHETTTSGITTAVWHGHRHQLMDDIAQGELDASRLGAEGLRLESPVQIATRTAVQDVEIGRIVAPKGTRVMAMLGAANRDPEVFPEPDTFRIDRDGSVPFGAGLHRCLGAHLADLELRVAVETVADLPLQLVSDEVEWGGSTAIRGIRTLMVRLR